MYNTNEIYRNELIFTNSTKFFKSKEVFSIKDIHNWLAKYTPEYHKIKEYSPKCNICLVKISDRYPSPNCKCGKLEETDEYKFCNFYEYLLFVWKFQKQDIKGKFRDFKDICISKDKVKLKQWYFRNEDRISEFICDTDDIFRSNTYDNEILIYDNDFHSEKDEVKIYIKSEDFKHAIEFEKLFEEVKFEEKIDYPYLEYRNKIFIKPISEERLFKSNYENITIPSLKKLFEKRRYFLQELQEWLEDNKTLAIQVKENYEKYTDDYSDRLSNSKDFKPFFSLEDDSFLLVVYPLLCNNLYELFALIEFANVQLKKVEEQQDIDLNYLSTEIREFCFDKLKDLNRITEQINEIGEYDILRYGEIVIEAHIDELTPIVELMKVFDKNYKFCYKPIYSTAEILDGVLGACISGNIKKALPYLVALNCYIPWIWSYTDFYKKLRIYFNDNEIRNIEDWEFETYDVLSDDDDKECFKYEFFSPKEKKIFFYFDVEIKDGIICFNLR